MPRKLHIYSTDDVLKSVREGVEITANCGRRKTLTRADVDKAANSDLKGCRKCMDVVTELTKQKDVTIAKRGWEELNRPRFVYRMTLKPGATGIYSMDWPLAG